MLRESRLEVVDQELLDELDSFVENRNLLFAVTRGGLPHPGDTYPAPLSEGSWEAEWFVDAPPDPYQIQGQVFVDGSCSKHVIKDLCRAAWACSVFSNGERQCEMRCPVHAPLPQSPQCAEFSGFTGAAMCLVGPSALHSDCLNVIKQFNAPPEQQADFKRVYAGHTLQAKHDDGAKHITDVIKVKAQQSLSDPDLSEEERFVRIGNDCADEGAKQAVLLHPSDEAQLEVINKQVKVVAAFCKLAMKLIPQFPSLKEEGEV